MTAENREIEIHRTLRWVAKHAGFELNPRGTDIISGFENRKIPFFFRIKEIRSDNVQIMQENGEAEYSTIESILAQIYKDLNERFPEGISFPYHGFASGEVIPVSDSTNPIQTVNLALQSNAPIDFRPHFVTVISKGELKRWKINLGYPQHWTIPLGINSIDIPFTKTEPESQENNYLLVIEANNTDRHRQLLASKDYDLPKNYPIRRAFALKILPPITGNDPTSAAYFMNLKDQT